MSFLPIAALIMVLLTLGVLFVGLVTFAKGGEFNRKHGNKLMQARVAFQLGALVLIGIMFLISSGD
ncbi:MAG: twin transmembrane helix small protein [Alphaproteobacteria bacterium]|jgi:hypothetical protein